MSLDKPIFRIFGIALVSSSLILSGCSLWPFGNKDVDEEDLAFEQEFSEPDPEFDQASGKSQEDDFFSEGEKSGAQGASGGDVFSEEGTGGFASVDPSTNQKELKTDIETLQSQQEALITRVRELQEIVQSMEPRLTATQDRLESSIGTASMETQSLEPEVLALKEEIARLNSEISDLKSSSQPRLAKVSKSTKPRMKSTFKTPPEYDQALAAYRAGNYDESILLFQEYSLKNPPDSLKDNVVFWIGSNYLKLQMFDEAISQFQNVLDQYPNGNKVHDSRLLMGISYQKKGDTGQALDILEAALKSNPPQEVRKKIEKQLMEIK